MKKWIAISCLFLLVGCANNSIDYGIEEISAEDVVLKVTNKETFLVMVSNENSYACDTFIEEVKPILKENNIVLYDFNVNDVEASELDQVEISLGEYTSWPTLFYVQDGEIAPTNHYEYSLDPEGWMLWMQNMGFIQK